MNIGYIIDREFTRKNGTREAEAVQPPDLLWGTIIGLG